MNFIKKWYTYQKERFPVIVYSLYIFAILFATFCICNYYGKINFENVMGSSSFDTYKINYLQMVPMFIVAFLQFLMVRIADEFKDYEEDCKYRAYRPVPRGLVTLKELKILFIMCVVFQIIITLKVNILGMIPLIIVWIFFAIMSKNFFIKKFLDKHILIEVLFDELLMPIMVIYLATFVHYNIPIYSMYSIVEIKYLWKFLLMSYIVSWIVEIARKVRCKEDEENGVKTYTAVFGIPKAVLILVSLETILMIIHTLILGQKYLFLTIGLYCVVNLFNLLFVLQKDRKSAKTVELCTNLYVMICYFSLGLLI